VTDDESRSRIRKLCPAPRILRDGHGVGSNTVEPVCSFCGKPLGQVACLVENGTAKICSTCIQSYAALVREPPAAD
jgi:hypothetical protein